jgi:eukaryotic-like serine/threonine-protein kinase
MPRSVSQSARLGPYELVRPLGAGGMAETFVALRRGPAGFEQRVCLKRILPGYAAEPSFIEQFLDEAQLLAQMSCAQIVQVFDFGEFAGTYYMALELVEGVDLEALLRSCTLRQQPLPRAVSLFIAAQLLSALDYAHSLASQGQPLHIVHRDISPSNVLLSRRGEVKLADFGIAKSSRRSHRTRPGRGKGKLAYLCPEQVLGDTLDARGDLFSLGVVLYEMLSGQHPFMDESEHTLLENILAGRRRSLTELVPDLPAEVTHFVDQLLAVEPGARAQSARAALDQLPLAESSFAVQRQLAELVAASAPHAQTQISAGDDASGTRGPPTTQPILPQTPAQDARGFTPHEAGAHTLRSGRARRRVGWAVAVVALGASSWYGVRTQEPRRAPIPAAPVSAKPAANLATRAPELESARPAQALPTASAEDAAVPPSLEIRGSPLHPRVATSPRVTQPAAPAAVEPPPNPAPANSAAVKGRSGIALRTDDF